MSIQIKPCEHPTKQVVKVHCGGGAECAAGKRVCHLACYCRACDRQWSAICEQHGETE